jgi:hypothetical protein
MKYHLLRLSLLVVVVVVLLREVGAVVVLAEKGPALKEIHLLL